MADTGQGTANGAAYVWLAIGPGVVGRSLGAFGGVTRQGRELSGRELAGGAWGFGRVWGRLRLRKRCMGVV